MSKQLVAAIDGVMVKAGDAKAPRYVTLYQGGGVPKDADADHVKVLVERQLLVESDEADEAEGDGGDTMPAKSASREEWDAYASSQGLSDEDIAGFSSKADLQAHFAVS